MRALFFCLIFLGIAQGADIVVVTSKSSSIEQLSRQQVRDIYLKKKQFIGDTKIIAVNLPASNQARALFDRVVLSMEPEELSEHWNRLHYNGINPPLVQNSFEGVKAFVKKVDGAIGYIDSGSVDSGLKVIAVLK